MAEIIIQPDPTAGSDTFLREAYPATNYGAQTVLTINGAAHPLRRRRGLIQFDLSTLAAYAGQISMARLQTFRNEIVADIAELTNINWHRVTASWVEGQATWASRATASPWATPGGDFDPNPTMQMPERGFAAAGQPICGTLTGLLLSWLRGDLANNGLLVKWENDDSGLNEVFLCSSDYATPAFRPRLYVVANDVSPYLIFPVASDAVYSQWAATHSTKAGALIWPTTGTAADPPFTSVEEGSVWGALPTGVLSGGVTRKQSWTLADPCVPISNRVSNVRLVAACYRTLGDLNSPLRIGVHVAGTDHWQTPFVPPVEPTNAADYAFDWPLNPATGGFWTADDLAALEVVAEAGAPAADICVIGRLYGFVAHSEPPPTPAPMPMAGSATQLATILRRRR